MTQPQTVTGFFDNKAEAQQAVQYLLRVGFKADCVHLSDQAAPDTRQQGPTDEERSTGRFFSSLFGDSPGTGPVEANQDDLEEAAAHASTTVVTVQVQSTLEVDQAVDSLKRAGTVSISQSEAL